MAEIAQQLADTDGIPIADTDNYVLIISGDTEEEEPPPPPENVRFDEANDEWTWDSVVGADQYEILTAEGPRGVPSVLQSGANTTASDTVSASDLKKALVRARGWYTDLWGAPSASVTAAGDDRTLS